MHTVLKKFEKVNFTVSRHASAAIEAFLHNYALLKKANSKLIVSLVILLFHPCIFKDQSKEL